VTGASGKLQIERTQNPQYAKSCSKVILIAVIEMMSKEVSKSPFSLKSTLVKVICITFDVFVQKVLIKS